MGRHVLLAAVAALTFANAGQGAEPPAAMPSPEERNPLGFPSYVQKILVVFDSASSAEEASLEIAPLFGGAELAFTSRWDDSNGKHVARAKMFESVGLNATFFLNGDKGFMEREAPKIAAAKSRFGNHTVSHPFLMQSGANFMFSEVMRNRVTIEAATDMPVTSFVIPYNWNNPIDPSRAAMLGKVLVNTGHFVSSDGPRGDVAQKPYNWMPGHTFSANDTKPDTALFEKNLAGAVAKAKEDPDHPKATFGIHSWCDEEGLARQRGWLETLVGREGWWHTDDSRYGAYRYEFYHGRVRKVGVKGNVAIFEIERFDPAFLGAAQPLSVKVSPAPKSVSADGAALVADGAGFHTLPHAAGRVMPDAIGEASAEGLCPEFPGLRLFVSVDEGKGALTYALKTESGERPEVIDAVVYAPPAWSKMRIPSKAAAATVSLGEKSAAPEFLSGDRLYFVGVDFVRDGKRGRLYGSAIVKAEPLAASATTPRDNALVLGPFHKDKYDEEKWRELSVPSAVLTNMGDESPDFWHSMADPKRVGYSASSYIPWEERETKRFKDTANELCSKKLDVILVAVDFKCDSDGEKDLLLNREKWEAAQFMLNGEVFQGKGGKFRIKVKKGLNRLIVRWFWTMPWTPQSLLLAVCDDGDVNNSVVFVRPKVESRPCEFESDGFSCELTMDAGIRKLTYRGETIIASTAGGMGPGLPVKKEIKLTPVFKRADGMLTASVDAPPGAKSDDYAMGRRVTVAADYVEMEAFVQVRDGIEWKGIVGTVELFFPVSRFVGKELVITDIKGGSKSYRFSNEYDKANDLANFTALDIGGEWRLTVEGGFVMQMFDRRQWRQQTVNMKIIPSGGANWGAPKADSRKFLWKWRLERIGTKP